MDDDEFDPFADPADDTEARAAEALAEAQTKELAAQGAAATAGAGEAAAAPQGQAERPNTQRPYDLVVYGATGYTGCLVLEHLDALLSEPGAKAHRWAAAGRSREKLEKAAGKCKTVSGVCVATTEEELESMAASCFVVINCVGPFLWYGPAVVAACLKAGTHYVDVSGEVVFARRIIDAYSSAAKDQGLMVVPYCGYDAAVFDIGGYLLAKKLGPLTLLREYWICHPIPPKGGPALSGIAMTASATWEEIENFRSPFSLGGERECGVREEDLEPTEAVQDTIFPSVWVSLGLLSRVTLRCVRWTVGLFEERPVEGLVYGKGICVSSVGASLKRLQANDRARNSVLPQSAEEQAAFAAGGQQALDRGERGVPGLGPGRAMRAELRSESLFVAQGESGEWAHVHYKGPEVSEATAIPAVAAALVLLEEPERLAPGERGGVLTPGFAFHGSSWLERVAGQRFALLPEARPMAFELHDGKPSEDYLLEVMKDAQAGYNLYVKQMMAGTLPNGGNEVPDLLA